MAFIVAIMVTMNAILIFMKNISILVLFCLSGLIFGCNKDDVIENITDSKPEIILDNEDGVYTVKIGKELTINPTIKNADNAIIKWTLDGQIVCRESVFTRRWDTEGVFYPVLSVITQNGVAEEELKVEVLALTPPVISLKLPSQGLKVVAGTDYQFTPNIQHDDLEDFKIEWYVDGEAVSNEKTYTFHKEKLGNYNLKIVASNIDGKTEKEFTVEVVENLPYSVSFQKPYYTATSTTRYTFAGRPVFLRPNLEYFDNPQFVWTVNGNIVDCASLVYKFTPSSSGEYNIAVSVSEGSDSYSSISQNITQSAIRVKAEVKVICVDATEQQRIRPKSASSSPYSNKVYEWTPAPGQFIGETGIGGMSGNENTFESANTWAQKRLADKNFVSLGGFGGYIIVGFDHSIAVSGNEYDFAIMGNAFNSDNGGSNEPGIVWVMQDVNGNGLPDDEWYELRGCETGGSETIQNYSVTYFRPAGPGQDVEWTDSEGKNGCIDYLSAYHHQDYYYPAWIKSDSYTLWGTRLPAKNKLDPTTGFWANNAYDWGYADNMGSDRLKGSDTVDGSGQRNGFKISNAMYLDATPVKLQYIDFIKVQVGVNAKSGWLGEVSTEVFNFQDLSLIK